MDKINLKKGRYIFVYSKKRNIEFVNSGNNEWKTYKKYQRCFFCINEEAYLESENWGIIIGIKHDNGDGLYSEISCKANRVIKFGTDSISSAPVYYLEDKEYIVVSSDIEMMINIGRLLKLHLKVDYDAMTELFISSYFFSGARTALEGVRQLPPGSVLTISLENGKVALIKNDNSFDYFDKSWDWDYCLEQFHETLHAGLQRYDGKKVAVLLSGGADSRCILSSAMLAGLDLDIFTFGHSTVNASDFAIANVVAYKYGKKTRCFSAAAENFIGNWKNYASYTNWANDSLWWSARLPATFFSSLGEYDVVLRGDGEGIYGWGGSVANIDDVLNQLEISNGRVVQKYGKYFMDSSNIFNPAIHAREDMEKKYSNGKSFINLKNKLYYEVREWLGISPISYLFNRFTAIDSPFLWQKAVEVAKKLPRGKRIDKKLIYETNKRFPLTKEIPYSSGSSWNNSLDYYYTGVWEELLDYIRQWSPRELDHEKLRKDYLKPPPIPREKTFKKIFLKRFEPYIKNSISRKIVFRYFPGMISSTMSNRLLIRLAIESSLCEKLAERNNTGFYIK